MVHSLRGNFKDLMRDANVTKENHDFMTGHGEGDAAGLYGIGPSLKARAAFNKASHPWITESRNFASKMKALFESPVHHGVLNNVLYQQNYLVPTCCV